jgi:Tfp pilus assembly protein PilO
MKRLPPAKRNQLIGVVVASLALIFLVYFFLILPQNDRNRSQALNINHEKGRLQEYESAIQQKAATQKTLDQLNQQLAQAEQDIASGDLYAWTVDNIRRFKVSYPHVEIPTTGEPVQSDCELFSEFPYKQIRFSLAGTAYYHDLGKFLSDFENRFTHCRVVNLSLDPSGDNSAPTEKLNFKVDIVALVKPNN